MPFRNMKREGGVIPGREASRKLGAGAKTDVNLDDLTRSYGFGIGLFDNAQVRHADTQAPLMLQFK